MKTNTTSMIQKAYDDAYILLKSQQANTFLVKDIDSGEYKVIEANSFIKKIINLIVYLFFDNRVQVLHAENDLQKQINREVKYLNNYRDKMLLQHQTLETDPAKIRFYKSFIAYRKTWHVFKENKHITSKEENQLIATVPALAEVEKENEILTELKETVKDKNFNIKRALNNLENNPDDPRSKLAVLYEGIKALSYISLLSELDKLEEKEEQTVDLFLDKEILSKLSQVLDKQPFELGETESVEELAKAYQAKLQEQLVKLTERIPDDSIVSGGAINPHTYEDLQEALAVCDEMRDILEEGYLDPTFSKTVQEKVQQIEQKILDRLDSIPPELAKYFVEIEQKIKEIEIRKNDLEKDQQQRQADYDVARSVVEKFQKEQRETREKDMAKIATLESDPRTYIQEGGESEDASVRRSSTIALLLKSLIDFTKLEREFLEGPQNGKQKLEKQLALKKQIEDLGKELGFSSFTFQNGLFLDSKEFQELILNERGMIAEELQELQGEKLTEQLKGIEERREQIEAELLKTGMGNFASVNKRLEKYIDRFKIIHTDSEFFIGEGIIGASDIARPDNITKHDVDASYLQFINRRKGSDPLFVKFTKRMDTLNKLITARDRFGELQRLADKKAAIEKQKASLASLATPRVNSLNEYMQILDTFTNAIRSAQNVPPSIDQERVRSLQTEIILFKDASEIEAKNLEKRKEEKERLVKLAEKYKSLREEYPVA